MPCCPQCLPRCTALPITFLVDDAEVGVRDDAERDDDAQEAHHGGLRLRVLQGIPRLGCLRAESDDIRQ